MCNPLAIGSKQANSTIWTRCRGGKPLRSPRALSLAEYGSEPALLITATKAPDGGRITLHLAGDQVNPLAGSNRQQNARMLDLEPGLRATMGDLLQDRDIVGGDVKPPRTSTTHGQPPN